MRNSYWSNSRLADFIRGSKKPGALTGQGWNKWEKASKLAHPVRYWIGEEGFDLIQKVLYWPADHLHSCKYWFTNRFITRTHALTSSSLKKGAWAEMGTRVLHCNFDELINFVEIDQAWSHVAWGDEGKREQYRAPWYATGWWRFRTWRSAEAGLAHLYWAAALTFDHNMGVNPGSQDFGLPTPQAATAMETIALYHWWKNVRPARPDVHDASGWTAICDLRREKALANGDDDGLLSMLDDDETPEEAAASSAALNKSQEMEKAYEQEDEEMLIRFVKLAPNLWT